MSSNFNSLFILSANRVKNLKSRPSNDELLKLYALYKQGTVGDCTKSEPSMFNIKEKQKWNAWKSVSGLSQDDAKINYIKLVKLLIEKYD